MSLPGPSGGERHKKEKKKKRKEGEAPGLFDSITEHLPDPDDVFSYDTVKEVRVLDRRLGIVFYGVLFAVIVYIVLYVFMIKRLYLDFEKTNGFVISEVLNPAYDEKGAPWDIFDAVTNSGEQGAVFVPTRVLVTRGQVQEDFCESPTHSCQTDAECDIGDALLQKPQCSNGRCMRRQWCPAAEVGKPTTEEHLVRADQYAVWFKSILHFHKFQLDVSTTDEKKSVMFPARNPNTFRVADLLRMAQVRLEEVQHLGAIIQVSNKITCDLDSASCKQNLEADAVETRAGFNYKHAHTYFQDGVKKRDEYHFFGIRIIATSTGYGQQVSLGMIVLQVSSAIALLASAQTAADMCLLYLVPERRHYTELKIEETEDFNES